MMGIAGETDSGFDWDEAVAGHGISHSRLTETQFNKLLFGLLTPGTDQLVHDWVVRAVAGLRHRELEDLAGGGRLLSGVPCGRRWRPDGVLVRPDGEVALVCEVKINAQAQASWVGGFYQLGALADDFAQSVQSAMRAEFHGKAGRHIVPDDGSCCWWHAGGRPTPRRNPDGTGVRWGKAGIPQIDIYRCCNWAKSMEIKDRSRQAIHINPDRLPSWVILDLHTPSGRSAVELYPDAYSVDQWRTTGLHTFRR